MATASACKTSGIRILCRGGQLILFTVTLVLVVGRLNPFAATVEASAIPQQHAGSSGLVSAGETTQPGMNNLESLISEFLDDAGDRLKKSRMTSRQVKHTLRFGRRSDPLMAPNIEPMSLRDLQDNQILAELGY